MGKSHAYQPPRITRLNSSLEQAFGVTCDPSGANAQTGGCFPMGANAQFGGCANGDHAQDSNCTTGNKAQQFSCGVGNDPTHT
ncbi:MAG: hypothetical protein ACYTHM_23330 [Planctomycetota bacterium]|jgi:hypothetical protein